MVHPYIAAADLLEREMFELKKRVKILRPAFAKYRRKDAQLGIMRELDEHDLALMRDMGECTDNSEEIAKIRTTMNHLRRKTQKASMKSN